MPEATRLLQELYAAHAPSLLRYLRGMTASRESAEDLLHHLQVWQQKAGDRFNLATVTDRAMEVAGLAARFQARLNAAAAQRVTPEVARQLVAT